MTDTLKRRLAVGPEYREDKVDGGIEIWPTLTRAEIAEIMAEASAEIERLEKALETAREALEPFAKEANYVKDDVPDLKDLHGYTFQAADFRRAAAAIRTLSQKKEG